MHRHILTLAIAGLIFLCGQTVSKFANEVDTKSEVKTTESRVLNGWVFLEASG